MKIAVIGMPRTATKTVLRNMSKYLEARYGVVSNLIDSTTGIVVPHLDEMLNSFIGHFQNQADLINDNVVLSNRPIVSIDDELAKRIGLLRIIKLPFVVKHFPFSHQLQQMPGLTDSVDRVYYLSRRNTFEHALSFCISKQTHSWAVSDAQRSAIANALENRIIIPADTFRKVTEGFNQYNLYLYGKKTIDFETIVKIRSSTEFCSIFELEEIDFEFRNDDIEYGDNKLNMISNVDELMQIYKNIGSATVLESSPVLKTV